MFCNSILRSCTNRLKSFQQRAKSSNGTNCLSRTDRYFIIFSWLEGREKWSNLQGIGVIFSETEENGKKSKQAHYFIYSCKGMTAAQILEAKRSHWGIENKLLWVLDMQFREDESRARADNSAENLNVLRHWAYNLLKAQSSLKGSFSGKQFKCLLDEAFPDEVIASALCS
ncbi:MAG: ISAs1 family transposase [Oscillospiraceae bacterium]|nr:ISAs1 family transposase [Oscillospiraceae bacterium]